MRTVIDTGRPQNIDELELYFDEALSRLRVYELPLFIALHVSLSIFEELYCTTTHHVPERTSAYAAMLHHKGALEVLIPNLFKRCRQEELPKERPIVTRDIVNTAFDALSFCERYQFAVHSYTLYHQKQFTGSLSGRVVDFQYSKGFNLGRSSLSPLLHNYHEQRTVNQSWLSGMLPSSIASGKSRQALMNLVQSKDVRTILGPIPDDVYIPIREITEAAISRPSVDTNASCGSYTISDYYNFWIEFMVRMSAYNLACERRSSIDKSFNFLEHRILQFTLPELSAILASKGTVEYGVALSILTDLVLDSTASRPDILIQPLVPMPNTEIVLIAPSLIFTANWEVCVLRNWTRLYPDMYGKVIASKKGELAKSLCSALHSKHFVTSANRKLSDGKEQTISDVDVAAFDPSEGLLAMFQVKWLIEPDSTRETIRTDAEISYAFEQSVRCKHAFENDRGSFLKQVFPGSDIAASAVKEFKCYVVARGDMGNKDDEANDIYVLDYLLSMDVIANSTNVPLRQILSRIVNKQAEISNSIEETAHSLKIKLAGYLIRVPGYSGVTRPVIRARPKTKQPHRNDRCICGSGRKYKKCCLELASYAEDVVREESQI
jgi:hypothetical protein